MTTVAGIDVSKRMLDMATSESERLQVRYSRAGIRRMVKALKSARLVVMEPTGGYERAILAALQKASIPVALVNARQVRDFAKASGILAKTDRLDARVLAEFGRVMNPTVRAMKRPIEQSLKDWMVRRRQLIQMLAQEKTRMAAAPRQVQTSIRDVIQLLQQQLKALDHQINELVQTQPDLKRKAEHLRQVPGIGVVTSHVLIAQLPELGQLTKKSVAALVGVAPFNRDSGTLRGKRTIWGGRAMVRCGLYMGTLSGIRKNPVLREFYQRLRARGKAAKVAIVACMRKLIVILNAMLKNNTPWRYQAQTA